MKRRGGACCLLTLSIAVIASIGVYFANRPKTLLDYATKVADTSDWQSTRLANIELLPYCWLSPAEVLYASAGEGGKLRLMKRRIDRPNEPPATLPITVRLDTENWQVSPNGRAISYDVVKAIPGTMGRARKIQSTMMATLDGKSSRPVSIAGGFRVWAADSASVFTAGAPYPTTIHQTFLATGKTRVIGLPILLTRRNPGTYPVTWFYALDEHHRRRLISGGLGPGYSRNLPASMATSFPSVSIQFADVSVDNPKAPVKTWSVPTPGDSDYGYVSPSPQGDKLLWVTTKKSVSLPDMLIQRIYKNYSVHRVRYIRLQVSDLEGRNIHTIAAYQAPPSINPGIRYPDIQWTPDGKKISFAMKGSLYTIPAD